jgi:DNA polymerase V
MNRSFKQTGFPSPANDYIAKNLNLNELLIKHPSATYFIRFKGSPKFNVMPNDLLIVDKALNPSLEQLVIVTKENGFKLEKYTNNTPQIWGTVTSIIRHA